MVKLLKRKKIYLIGVLILIVVFFLRFYDFSNIPRGLYPDETAIGYNAYSITQTGRDEYGEKFPLYFKSFDDYKLPLYIYSTSLFIKIFGANDFSVRLTSALFGSISIIVLFFIIRLMSKNNFIATTIAISLALNPWHFFFSRSGYEVNVATSLILIGLYFFILATKRSNNLVLFSASCIFFVLSVYTYNVTRLIAPLILITLIIFYFKNLTQKSKKPIILMFVLFTIFMIPFLHSFLSLQNESGFSSHRDALIIGNITRAEIIETRSYFIDLPIIIQKIVFNYWTLVGFTYLKNLVSFFSTQFYFITGAEKPNQNITTMAMFYYFEFPFILYGCYMGIKKRQKFLYPFFLWAIIIFIFGSIIKTVPNGTRSFPIVIPLAVFSGYGFYELIKLLNLLSKRYIKYAILIGVITVMIYSYSYFFLSYFYRYPIERAVDWRSEDKITVEYIKSIDNKYSKIIFDEDAEFFYTSFAFYSKFDPQKYQKSAKYRQNGLVAALEKVDKYEFRKVDFKNEDLNYKTLYISKRKNVPNDGNILTTFYYPQKPIAVYYDRKIGQLSVTDEAYTIFEKR